MFQLLGDPQNCCETYGLFGNGELPIMTRPSMHFSKSIKIEVFSLKELVNCYWQTVGKIDELSWEPVNLSMTMTEIYEDELTA